MVADELGRKTAIEREARAIFGERKPARRHLVQHDAETPDVAAGVHVERRASARATCNAAFRPTMPGCVRDVPAIPGRPIRLRAASFASPKSRTLA